MTISRAAWRLEQEAIRLVNQDPIIITRYLLRTTSNGITGGNSWYMVDSLRGTQSNLPRSTWFPSVTDGLSTKHLFEITVPASQITGPEPTIGQRITIQNTAGDSQGTYRINYVAQMSYDSSTYAYSLVVERILP